MKERRWRRPREDEKIINFDLVDQIRANKFVIMVRKFNQV